MLSQEKLEVVYSSLQVFDLITAMFFNIVSKIMICLKILTDKQGLETCEQTRIKYSINIKARQT